MTYNPSVTNRSGEIMAAGISNVGNTIADTITKTSAALKKQKAMRTAATDIFGMDKAEVDKMSAEDIEAHMSGQVLKTTLDRAKREAQAAADADDQRKRALQFQQLLAQPDGDGADAETSGDWANEAMPGNGASPRFTPQRFLDAASKSGYRLDPREMLAMMKESQGTDWQGVMPREFEIGGVKGAVGKSGQFQFLPQATPDSLTAIPVYDEDGNVIGQRVPTTKGGTAALPAPKAPKELPNSFFEPYHKTLQNWQDATAQAAKTDDELKALATSGTPEQKRKRYQTEAAAQQEKLRKHFELYRSQGYGTPEFWDGLYKENNLTAPAAGTNTPAASSGAGSSPAAGRLPSATNPKTGETLYFKDGKWQK